MTEITTISTSSLRADYGLDAPGIVRALLLCGGFALLLGILIMIAAPDVAHRIPQVVSILIFAGGGCMFGGGLMMLSSYVGKVRLRDRLLDRLALAPDARVLDAGCGHGLLLIGAARRVPAGRAVGLDLWSQTDQARNSRAMTLANAVVEGVADRVEVHDGDMRSMPFADGSFDAVVSSLAIHNIAGRKERQRAIAEIARVLRPSGQVAIVDIAHIGEYAAAFRAAGFREVHAGGLTPWIYPPARVLTARK